MKVYGCIPNTLTNQAVATFIQSLAPLNSAANPLIYCLFSTNAGQNLCDFIGCCCFGRGKRSGNGNNNSAKDGNSARSKNGSKSGGGILKGKNGSHHMTAQTTKSTSLLSDSAAGNSSHQHSSTAGNGNVTWKNNNRNTWSNSGNNNTTHHVEIVTPASIENSNAVNLAKKRISQNPTTVRTTSVVVNDF